MRPLFTATVVGVALAAALLTFDVPGATSATPWEHSVSEDSGPSVVNPPPSPDEVVVFSHTNANTEHADHRLNGNLINGTATVVCTTNATYFGVVKDAIGAWNDVLHTSGLRSATDPALKLHTAAANKLPSSCADSSAVDIHVIVRHRVKGSEGECPGPSACYWSIPGNSTKPQQKYKRDSDVRQRAGEQAAEIVIHTSTVTKATIIHELGHVLGLIDYMSCEALRVKGSGPAATDPDFRDQHYSVMYNAGDRECRPSNEETITDRDLRDLYEAYHVGPVTKVRVPWYGTSASKAQQALSPSVSGDTLSFSVAWGDGIGDAAHNASRVAVLGYYAGHGWELLEQMKVPAIISSFQRLKVRADRLAPPKTDELPQTSANWPTRYKVVGLTQGDIRWEGRRVHASIKDAKAWTFDRELVIGGSSYTEGDPTFLVGRLVDKGKVVSYPPTLSASISPRYCWAGGNLSVSVWAGGGTKDNPTVRLVGNNMWSKADALTNLDVPCGTGKGERRIAVESNHNSGTLIQIPFAVHGPPPKLALTLNVAGLSCTTGSDPRVIVPWTVSGLGSATLLRVKINNRFLANPTPMTTDPAGTVTGTLTGERCGAGDDPTLATFPRAAIALASDGRGATATTLSAPSVVNTSQPPDQPSGTLRTVWSRVPGAGGYEVRYLDHRGVPGEDEYVTQTPAGINPSYTFSGLRVGQTYRFEARARKDRARTAWTKSSARTIAELVLSSLQTTSERVSVTATRLKRGGGLTAAVQPSFQFDLRLEERVADADQVQYVQRLSALSPRGRSQYTHTFQNDADPNTPPVILAGRTYRVRVRLITQEAPDAEWLSAPELAATFALTQTVTAQSATLSWRAVAGAKSYRIRVNAGDPIAVPSGTSYRFAGLSANQNHALAVQALYGGSERSAWRTTTLCISPCSPTVSGVSAGGATLSWEGAAGPSAVHQVQLRSGQRVLASATAAGSSHTFSGLSLAANSTYSLAVRQGDSASGPWTDWVSTTMMTPNALSLSVEPTVVTCVAGGPDITISWRVSGGLAPYAVLVDGASSSGGSHELDCPAIPGRSSVTVSVTDSSTPALTASQRVTLTAIAPLSLTASAGAAACQVGSTMAIYWTVSGGALPYIVTVDGVRASASPHTVPCRQTAGTQTVTLVATDSGSPLLTRTRSVSFRVAAPALNLTTSASPSSCQRGQSVRVNWVVTGGAKPYTVTVDGVVDSASPATVACTSTTGSQRVQIVARDAGRPAKSVTRTLTLAVTPPPLALAASTSASSCQRGSSVRVNWSISGGTTPYTVTVDGTTDRASPASVACTATGSSQTIVVAVRDSSKPALRQSKSLTVSVTKPPAAKYSFEGRSRARIRSSGRVEFCFQLKGGSCILPSSRYLSPASMTAGRWYHSSSVVQGSRTLGVISVMKPSGAAYLDVCFTPAGGTRACPTPNNFYWKTATVDSWLNAGWKSYSIADGATGSAGATDLDSAMQPPQEGEPAGGNTDGGAMQEE